MTREDAVKGLRNVADWHYGKYEQTHEEDYLNDGDFLTAVANMLRAQEPRVISWQDAESMRLCWIETRYPHTISPADLMHYYDEGPTITVFKIHQNAIDWPLDEYGIKWRCWDKEPTDEQMEAVKWDG